MIHCAVPSLALPLDNHSLYSSPFLSLTLAFTLQPSSSSKFHFCTTTTTTTTTTMHQPQQGDMTSSYYQYYQPHFQPTPTPNPTPTPTPTPYASAPPVTSSSADYSSYSFNNPSFSQNYDHASAPIPNPNPNPNANPNPNPNPSPRLSSSSSSSTSPYLPPNPNYSFPHLDPNSAAYYPYDQNQSTPLNYDYSNPNPNPNANYSSAFSSGSYSSAPYSAPPSVPGYDSNVNYGDQGMYGAGVYKYSGGKTNAYGGREGRSGSESSRSVLFDDYGRPINVKSTGPGSGSRAPKIVKAVPKVEDQTDVKSSVQKFRTKLLSEGYGQADMDVLCQIGLDGIRILDPATSRMLKIYPLETVTRCEVLDSYIFAFWAKTSVDAEPRRVRLKSNSYTTNNILDTVTAASIQVKEMAESSKPSDSLKGSEQSAEKKKGFTDWMNLMKPGNEEKDHWVPDEAVTKCTGCGTAFNAFVRRHHCRNCGDIFCDKCTQGRIALTADENAQPVRVCDQCMAEVTQRLSNAKEAAARVTGLHSHEDLARKLQEEMNKNRKTSAGSVSGGSGTRMREVACPTCTVHLQVQVPASGSETIECSVCQHPFLVSAH